jgi:acyl-CoA thioesterase II
MGNFEVDTRVEGANGHYTATLDDDWRIWGPNGGYLAAIALRAAGAEARVPRPASFSAHFLAVGRFDRVDAEVEAIHSGRRSESLRVTLRQDDRVLLTGLLRTAAVTDGLEHEHGAPPNVPDPEGLKNIPEILEALGEDPGEPPFPFWNNIESKPLYPERFAEPPKPRAPECLEWFRFSPEATFEDPWVDAGRAVVLLDTLCWPAASRPHIGKPFQAPNLDLTVWFHEAAPESEWLLADHECRRAAGGLMGSTGRIFSRDRKLLASGGAQLYCVPGDGR